MGKVLLGVFLAMLGVLSAQHIPQKGSLGVYLKPNEEPSEPQAAFQIERLVSGGTAEQLGLEPNDVLISVNGHTIQSGADVQQHVKPLAAGAPIELLVQRGGRQMSFKGTLLADPMAQSKPNLKLLEVPFGEAYMRGYLHLPDTKGPVPVVFFVQGYTCQTVAIHPKSPMQRFADYLTERGLAVFMAEKPGVQPCYQCRPCEENTFMEEVEYFGAALEFLKQQKEISPDQVYLFGHSLGGLVVPLLGQKHEVAGLSVFGTLVRPWVDYLEDMAWYSNTASQPVGDLVRDAEDLRPALAQLFASSQSEKGLSEVQKNLLRNWYGYDAETSTMFSRPMFFWRGVQEIPWLKVWNSLDKPTLAMHGASDAHAIHGLDAELIAQTLNQKQMGLGSYVHLEATNHLMAKVSSRKEELLLMQRGLGWTHSIEHFNEALPQAVVDWIAQVKQHTNAYYQDARGTFPYLQTVGSTMDVAFEDLNEDGRKDLILATEFGNNLVFWQNDSGWFADAYSVLPAPEAEAPMPAGEDSEALLVKDFNGDGRPDLFFASEDSKHHILLWNKGEKRFALATEFPAKQGAANAALSLDANGDGWPDILLGIRGQNELYLNQKGKGFVLDDSGIWPRNTDHSQDLLLSDIDQDGDLDVLEAAETGGSNVYLFDGSTFVEAPDFLGLGEQYECRKVVAADVDGDGDEDYFFCHVGWNPEKDARNCLLLQQGKGRLKPVALPLPGAVATTLDAAFVDLSGDGLPDLITTNFVDDEKVQVWEAVMSKGVLSYELREGWLPPGEFYGGVRILPVQLGARQGLYFGNYRSADKLMLAPAARP